METFEFLVTSTVQATLYEHIKIQALNYEDAVTRIEDRDYYEEDGEIVDSKTEIDDYLEVDDISNWEGSTTITIRICRREILQLLQDVITNNNLFHLKRKWNKLMIKEPSASES